MFEVNLCNFILLWQQHTDIVINEILKSFNISYDFFNFSISGVKKAKKQVAVKWAIWMDQKRLM